MVADVTWKLELCSSSAHNGPTARITALAGPLQCLTKGLADLNRNGPSKILTLADGGLRYKTSKDSQEAAEAVQQQLDSVSVSTWCHDTGSLISPDKAQTLWCTLDNRAADNQCQQSHLMVLLLNAQVNEIPWDPLLQNADLQKTR